MTSPTSLVWVLGPLYCAGTPEGYEAAHAMQDAMELLPLSAYGTPYAPPPAAADAPMVDKMAKLGIVPGHSLDWSTVDAAMQQALNDAIKPTQGQILANLTKLGHTGNGWTFPLKTGTYGTDYLSRATVTMIGLGANLPADAVYPMSRQDAEGNPSSGDNAYVMHCDKGQLPPADAFWSLTMYTEQGSFVGNPLNRYTVSSRTQFATNADGSVDIYIQHHDPGKDKEANWLTAPVGGFMLMLRLYMPSATAPSILDGTWTIPPCRRRHPTRNPTHTVRTARHHQQEAVPLVATNEPPAEPAVLRDSDGADFGRVDHMHRTRYIEVFLAGREADTGSLVAAWVAQLDMKRA